MRTMAVAESGTRTLISPAQRSRGHAKVLYWAVLVILIPLFALIFLFPLYWMVTRGLKSPSQGIQSPPSLLPRNPQFPKYITRWNDHGLARIILNTVFYGRGAVGFPVSFDDSAPYAP